MYYLQVPPWASPVQKSLMGWDVTRWPDEDDCHVCSN